MGTDLAAMLRERRDDARRRKEASRQAMLLAEEDEKKWEAALLIELRSSRYSNGNGSNGHAPHDAVSSDSDLLSSPRVKYEIFMKRLREAGRPMRSSELIKAIPEVSERYIYYLIGKLKKNGELEVDKATKGVRPTQNGSAVKAEPPVAAGGFHKTGGETDTPVNESGTETG